MTVEERIIDWLKTRQPGSNGGVEIDGTTDLLSSGIVDSLGFLHLVSFVEDEYQIEIPVEDLIPDNFATPASVSVLVERALSHQTLKKTSVESGGG